MIEIAYLLCAGTGVLAGGLLLRSYRETRARLLLWAGLCFLGLGFENAFVFYDLVIVPEIDLSVYRMVVAFLAIATLVYGLIMDAS